MDDYAHRELLSVPPKLYFSLVNNYMGGHTLTWRVVDMNGESLDREHKTLNKHITDGKTKLVRIPLNLQDKTNHTKEIKGRGHWEGTHKHTDLAILRSRKQCAQSCHICQIPLQWSPQTLSSNANAKENIQLNKQNTNREQLMEMTPVEQARQHEGVWIQPNDSQRFKHGFR